MMDGFSVANIAEDALVPRVLFGYGVVLSVSAEGGERRRYSRMIERVGGGGGRVYFRRPQSSIDEYGTTATKSAAGWGRGRK
jgi:hypothetical protein